MTRGLLVIIVLLGASFAVSCSLEQEALPGRPCAGADDCGAAFACVRVPGREDTICAPTPPPEEVVGCAGQNEGSPCGDGDSCTEDDTCQSGACVGVAKDCGGDVCVDGVCQVVASCVEQAPRVVSGGAAVPRIAYNPIDDEVGVLFEAVVANGRTESFFVRVGSDGIPRSAPLQLTDGTPATADDVAVSSYARDIAFAVEQQTYGIIVDRGDVLGGIAYTSVTRDGIQSSGVQSIITSLLSALQQVPARLDGNGDRFFVAAVQIGSEIDSVVLDSVRADGSGSSLGNDTLVSGILGEVDIAASRRSGEVGVVFTRDGVDNVGFVRANLSGTVLVERVLSTGRPAGAAPVIAQIDSGYAVVWQEGRDTTRQLVGVLLDDGGAPRGGVQVLSADDEDAQLPAVASTGAGGVLVYVATVDGALEVRVRRLAADLTAGAPQTVRARLDGGFAPSADAAGGTVIVGFGAAPAGDTAGDVEVARVCAP
jgi:hypothetical protein